MSHDDFFFFGKESGKRRKSRLIILASSRRKILYMYANALVKVNERFRLFLSTRAEFAEHFRFDGSADFFLCLSIYFQPIQGSIRQAYIWDILYTTYILVISKEFY